jgi:hypothetical protein
MLHAANLLLCHLANAIKKLVTFLAASQKGQQGGAWVKSYGVNDREDRTACKPRGPISLLNFAERTGVTNGSHTLRLIN